jgi:peptide/nickel transport system substrate-binding protein/oligopeptide transport system substrate-binding protein
MSKSKKIFEFCLFIFLIFLILNIGCKEKSEAIQEKLPTAGGTFRYVQESPGNLDPAYLDDTYESSLVNQIFDGLLEFDVNLNVVPGLAQSWKVSQDGLTYTIFLKPNVRFHDGEEVTSEDVLFSLSRLLSPILKESSLAEDYLLNIEGAIEFKRGKIKELSGLRIIDRYTVEIKLEKQYAPFLTALAMDNLKIVPKRYFEKVGEEYFGKKPIGSGPFKFSSWIPNEEIVLIAYKNYFKGQPYLDSLIFFINPKFVPLSINSKMFNNGEVDIVPISIDSLSIYQNKGYQIQKVHELNLSFIGFNLGKGLLKNNYLRKAICSAINLDTLVANDPLLVKAKGIFPPGLPGYSPDVQGFTYDVDLAKEFIKKAGFKTKDKKLKLEYWTSLVSNGLTSEEKKIKSSLAQVGIELEVKHILSWLEYNEKINNKELQMFSMNWLADIPDPDSFLWSLFHTGGSNNFFTYSNDKVDELLEKGRREQDMIKRIEIYRQIEKIILDDAPFLPLYFNSYIYAIQPYIRNLEISRFGFTTVTLEKVWIDKTTGTDSKNLRNVN